MIYAAYDRSPYLHMIPIDDIVKGICELASASNVTIARLEDVKLAVQSPATLKQLFGQSRSMTTIETFANIRQHQRAKGILPAKG
jgi:hypothetical protein